MRTAEFSRSHFAIICLARRVVFCHRPVHQQAVYRVSIPAGRCIFTVRNFPSGRCFLGCGTALHSSEQSSTQDMAARAV